MAQAKAYALRAEYEESFGGATVGYGNERHTFDVAEALAAGDGKIVTDDLLLQAALEAIDGGNGPLLKTTTVGDNPVFAALPEGATGTVEQGHTDASRSQQASEPTDVPDEPPSGDQAGGEAPSDGEAASHSADSEYDTLSADEVKQELRSRKINFRGNAPKEELVQLLEDDDDARR